MKGTEELVAGKMPAQPMGAQREELQFSGFAFRSSFIVHPSSLIVPEETGHAGEANHSVP
jgi:hypothetical protein